MASNNLASRESIHKLTTEELQAVSDLALEELWLRGSWERVTDQATGFDNTARNFKAWVENEFGGIEEAWMAAEKGDKGAAMLLRPMMDAFEDDRFVNGQG